MRILVMENPENITKTVKRDLKSEGFAVDCILDGTAAERRISMCNNDYDLLILDIAQTNNNSIQICKDIRQQNIMVPIIILSACHENINIIEGLNAGADDYIIKPFSPRVLAARVRALLRRPKPVLPVTLALGEITLNPITKQVFKKNHEIKLTLKEFTLLEYFMRQPNRVLNREQIIASLWDFAFDSFSNVVDVHIANLRKKIGDKNGSIIETIYGVGYKFNL